MQFSGTTCSHVHNVINIECTVCIQYVIAWTHFNSSITTRWRQSQHFVHILLILIIKNFVSVTYLHEY